MASGSSSPWKTLFKLLLAGIGFGSCLCCCGLGMLGRLADLDVRAPLPGFPSSVRTVDLGAVLLPPGTPPQGAHNYEWRAESISPPQHFLSYKLGEELAEELEAKHVALGRRLRYRSLGSERFTYNAPAGCSADMRCIYEELMRTNAEPVRVLGDRFVTSIRERGLDAAQSAQLIVAFVQRIRYELPTDEPFGIVPPALVPAQDRGDCDSKAVLAVMLLRQAGIDAVVLYSDPLAHAAVGVGLPGSGTRLRHGGRSYQYAEVTAEGWPLGMIPPQYDKPRLWQVLPLSGAADTAG
ncbi:transglutaminase-like domain-containing protein [Myxococcus sp. RHSTA-1-4]|uniref:transglutaminase-like domain-containing protein n=1 Tax=Myxococcus sp. RHSTA-1-4 TaxID=2874601 RepID=UPI001CC0B71D|nr:transglutaminase-like domain-containing protein [Myxococcus sp. RHSTA-1-4]MBZ4421022.1 transglutaminase-like domain-containing protein [Myxococcus sp. RHSTA-1-4]